MLRPERPQKLPPLLPRVHQRVPLRHTPCVQVVLHLRNRPNTRAAPVCQQLNQVIHRVRRIRLRRLGDRLNHQPVLERVRPKRRHHPIQLILRELLMQQHFTRQFRALPH